MPRGKILVESGKSECKCKKLIEDMEVVLGMTSVSIENTSNTFSQQQQENSNLTTTTNKNHKPSKNSLLESETSVVEKYNGPNPFIKTVKYQCYRKFEIISFILTGILFVKLIIINNLCININKRYM